MKFESLERSVEAEGEGLTASEIQEALGIDASEVQELADLGTARAELEERRSRRKLDGWGSSEGYNPEDADTYFLEALRDIKAAGKKES